MAKTKTPPTETPLVAAQDDERLVLERLRRHLAYLGLTHTSGALDELSRATHERPAHRPCSSMSGAEVDHKSQARLTRRIRSSGLVEQKTLGFGLGFFSPHSTRARPGARAARLHSTSR